MNWPSTNERFSTKLKTDQGSQWNSLKTQLSVDLKLFENKLFHHGCLSSR